MNWRTCASLQVLRALLACLTRLTNRTGLRATLPSRRRSWRPGVGDAACRRYRARVLKAGLISIFARGLSAAAGHGNTGLWRRLPA
jgi:hypothetical protein